MPSPEGKVRSTEPFPAFDTPPPFLKRRRGREREEEERGKREFQMFGRCVLTYSKVPTIIPTSGCEVTALCLRACARVWVCVLPSCPSLPSLYFSIMAKQRVV